MEELKPCPFCGGTNIHVESEIDDFGNEKWSYICCYDCLASFFQQEAICDEDNIKAWNRRVSDESDEKKELEITISDSDRIECAIRHIQTAVDVDPWAVEIAVDAMEKQIPKEPEYKEEDRFVKNHFACSMYPYCPRCGNEVATDDMHCVQCGQKIYWEEE